MKENKIDTNLTSHCVTCKFWTKNTNYMWQNNGVCSELKISDKIDIELHTGWDGGYVKYIETAPNFGCVEHRSKDE